MNLCEFFYRSQGLTKAELSVLAQTSEPTIGALTRGARVDIKIMQRVAAVFGMAEHEAERLLDEVQVGNDGVPPAPDMRQAILAHRRRTEK